MQKRLPESFHLTHKKDRSENHSKTQLESDVSSRISVAYENRFLLWVYWKLKFYSSRP